MGKLIKSKVGSNQVTDFFLNEAAFGIDYYKRERQVILQLSEDITQIHEKADLMTLLSLRIKSFFYYVHAIVSLIDETDHVYRPFILDPVSSPLKDHPDYPTLIKSCFDLDAPFIQQVLAADGPVSFRLEELILHPKSPPFLRVNYECGIKEILMTPLKSNGRTVAFLHIYSDTKDSFTPAFRSLIKGIAPQISNAVSNVIRNELITQKEENNKILLDASYDLSGVRNRDDLAVAVHNSLKRLKAMRGYVIRKVNDDRQTMSAYIYDNTIAVPENDDLSEMLNFKFPIDDGLQNRVLASPIPILINVDSEIERGIRSEYLSFWKRIGFRKMVGVALRNGDSALGILWIGIDDINLTLLKGICSQISIAMANIMVNDELVRKQEEQQLLLDFCDDIAGVRTKADLRVAIFNVFEKLLNTKLAMLNLLEDDGVTLRHYMWDETLFEKVKASFEERMEARLDIHENYTTKVLNSGDVVIFSVEEELRLDANNPYALLWEKVGFKYAYATALRVGNTDIGTLWLLSNYINPELVKGICAQISVACANIRANERILAYKRILETENELLKEQMRTIYNFEEIIGTGDAMQKVYELMSMVAESNSTVLLTGETGTGKELIARAIHNASSRKSKVMVKVNCAALPANLIESELFGHEKGAFTGALERRIGKFELANNSTLFLDEIGEMTLDAQVKLLRVLQEKELERIGGTSTIKVNVRIIAATNRNLANEVAEGRFRSDLFYRLNVFPIHLPPLRDRRPDIVLLAKFFLDRYSKNTGKNIKALSAKVVKELNGYSWPGNVRELEHVIERSVLMATDSVIREVFLPVRNTETAGETTMANRTLEQVERAHIIDTLRRCAGKLAGPGGAAEYLDVPSTTLHSKLKKLRIEKKDYF
jgi:transcriptional regulator with GAF, ATPase, and Fis domain